MLHFAFCQGPVHSPNAGESLVPESWSDFGRSSSEGYDTVACFDTIMSLFVSLSADIAATWQQETQ